MKTALAPFRPSHIAHRRATKTAVNAKVREIVVNTTAKNAQKISDALVLAATGFPKLVSDNNGGFKEVIGNPDVNAAKLLFEYTLGKPKETVQHTGAVGIVALVAQLEQDDSSSQTDL